MDFEKIRVPYEGRREFGIVGSGGEAIARSIISQYFGGVGGAGIETGGNGQGYGGDENRGGNAKSFNAWLSKNSNTFDALELAGAPNGITDTIYVMGYRDMEQAQTLVGDINYSAATGSYDIQGIPSQGLSVVVEGNGTNSTVIKITADQTLQSGGTLTIPVAVNINDNPLDPYQYVWWQNQNKAKLIYLTYTWALDAGGSSNYFMDLSNQTAYVNCDSAGTMFSASIMTLACSATTSIGSSEIHPYYELFVNNSLYHATGYSIDQNGVLHFNYSGSNVFNFTGDSLPIDVKAYEHQGDAVPIAKKTMTIHRNYPTAEGADAVSHWITTSANQIKYNPNTGVFSPSAISATCWMQVGYHEPEIDSATTMWFWRSTYPTPTQYTAGTPIVVTAYTEETAYTFGLKNTEGKFYELEDVLVMRDGLSGSTGPQGPQGDSGKSAWYISLDNQNCSINADSDGNIYSGAVHPTCVAKVYYGSQRMATGFTWDIDASAVGDGMIIEHFDSPSVGCITFETTTALTFSAESIQISVSIKVSGETVDTKIWNITKSIAGEDGQTSKTYWLALNATEVSYNPNDGTISPSSISAVSYMQEGQLSPGVSSAETHIMMSKIIRNSGAEQGYNDYTMKSLIGINSYSATTYSGFRFKLYKGQAQVDQQDVLILMDGVDGTNGTNGRDGAAIRGPYDYYAVSASNQCWCAGSGTTQCGECDKWIDVVYKDGVYYRCIKSYQGKCTSGTTNAASGISNSEYWQSGENYDFIATNLLLAENAKITFLSNNQLYLMSGNNVTAGAAGGNGISFWAGWPEPSSAAPFSVNANGEMIATKGNIAGWDLTNSGYSYTNGSGEDYIRSVLNHDRIEFEATPAGNNQHFRAGIDGISITTEGTIDALSIGGNGTTNVKFEGNGTFLCEKPIIGGTDNEPVKMNALEADKDITFNYGTERVVGTPYATNAKIAFMTSTYSSGTYFSAVTVPYDDYELKNWYFNGDMDLGIPAQTTNGNPYMIYGTTAMVNDEIIMWDWGEVSANTYHNNWRNGGSANGYIVDVIRSGDTYYRCITNYAGWLNWYSHQEYWTSGDWITIRSGRFYEHNDNIGPGVWPQGIPYRWVGMWLATDTLHSSQSSYKNTTSLVPTGIYAPNVNKKGDTLYFEI